MALAPGTRIGVYEITAQIGEGGMGQVWRARDTTLGRHVAIKILPDVFAADADRLARFEREARTLAALNHPHIAAIYGFEKSYPSTLSASSAQAGSGQAGMHALVMELVEGDDVSQRIARGALPIDEALPIAKQIAEALEAAHEQGIVHRDLKPANIKVRADGTVKVLDFGLAKALDPAAASSPEAMNSPTITSPAMTQAGMILGTAAYMSPEQARGKAVDKRADIWAFGAVLFEMLTGQRAFGGEDIAQTLANVINKEPAWEALPPATPTRLRSIIARCLVKDPRQRLRDMGDVRLALEGAFETAAPQTAVMAPLPARGAPLAWIAFAVAVLGMVAMAVPTLRYLRETPPTAPPETRVDIVTPATDSPTSFALSPDGRQIVFAAAGDGASRLWLRSLATTTAQPLAGTEGAVGPFWSPDGRSVGFFADSKLKRIDLGGGAPQTLALALTGVGGTWNTDGVIVFAPSVTSALRRVSAAGGASTAVTTLAPQQVGHVAPHFLPDGGRFLFYIGGAPDVGGIYLGALDGRAPILLTLADSAGMYLPLVPGQATTFREGGWLLWVRAGSLVAQRLDAPAGALTGDPVTLAEGLAVDIRSYLSPMSVAATGLVAYRAGAGNLRQLTWFDRSGAARGTVGDADATMSHPRVSPDGRRVSIDRTVQGNTDIWLLLDGSRTSRLTFDAATDWQSVWSPDGSRIAFRSTRSGAGDIYEKPASGGGVEERIVASDRLKVPTSWTADGRFLLFIEADPVTVADMWIAPMQGDHAPSVFLKTPFREAYGVFSPDSRWVAYCSNESGRNEIYVRAFVPPSRSASADTSAAAPRASSDKPNSAGPAATGGEWQVSQGGGIYAVWRRDGKELYYLNAVGAMMAAPIATTGTTLAPGAPTALFQTRVVGGGVEVQQGWQYDVAPDGRFLINSELESVAAPITLLMNWQPGVK